MKMPLINQSTVSNLELNDTPASPMDDLMVSVWMITYNHEKFIAEAIEGVLKQQANFKFNLVIGEDGSTDGTARVVKEYADKYPNIIKTRFNNPNIGVMPNMIKTLQECGGKYIALCEGDDYWTDPLKLQKQVDFLENNLEYVVCYHDAKIIDQHGNLLSDSKLPDNFRKDFTSEELMKGAWALTLSMVFRNVISEYPDEMLKVTNGDIFLLVLLGKYGKGRYLDTVSPAAYRVHMDSIWSSLKKDEQNYKSFNSYLYMYQYHMKSSGSAFATEFLFEVVFPAFKRICPDKNPHQIALMGQAEISKNQVRNIYASSTYKIGNAILWPLKRLRNALATIKQDNKS